MQLSIILTSLMAIAVSASTRRPYHTRGSPSPTAATCTTTLFKPIPTLNLDKTTTVYTSTVTETSKVNCDGCQLVFTSIPLGPGPVRIITATVTATEPTTTTTIVCATHKSAY